MIKKAFWDGFEKNAAGRSEIVGTVLSGPASVVGGIAGVAKKPYTDEELKEVNKKKWSNLIPGVGAYRQMRRMTGVGMTNEERKK
jgi:orotidine-5'-phosphate decarboxylase